MTETSIGITVGSLEDTELMRLSNDGTPFPGTELKIIDREDKILRINEVGEICVRSPYIMLGYWGEEVKTKEAINPSGWLSTGDTGSMDSNGYVIVTGRIKDVIVRGGQNIHATDVENLFYSHPKVQDAQVVGIPDERLGEKVAAAVKLKDGESCSVEELKEFLLERLEKFSVPEHIIFVKEMPMTITGKVKKFVLRDQILDDLKNQR